MIVLIQVIVGIFVFAFLGRLLFKWTKNSLLAASLLAAFSLIWTDAGGLAQAEKVGALEFIKNLILDIFAFGFFFFSAYYFILPNEKDK